MKKMLRICLLTVFCMIFVTLGGFLALTWYYGRTFVVNTWINGIYCTGMTVEEVNSELVRNMEMPELTIIDGEGQSWRITGWITRTAYGRTCAEGRAPG